MKIVLLAGYNVIHTVRWANSLSRRGHDVHLLSLHRYGEKLDPQVRLVILPFPPPLGYYLNAPLVRLYLRRVHPQLVNAHYASGYGTLGRLSAYHPYVLSVWGSDVYDFPNFSGRNRHLVVKNLSAADMVCSTSHAMGKVTRELCPNLIAMKITPFGVDIDQFTPGSGIKKDRIITIGTVKKLENKYGIDVLIRSFARLREKLARERPDMSERLRLLIVGGGSREDKLKQLAFELGISEVTQFKGIVPYSQVPALLRQMDIYAAFSRLNSESFGVAILEAAACGIPVVVSDADGPSEVVIDTVTGLIVPRENIVASSAALETLVMDRALRLQLGQNGRSHVVGRYDWENSVDIMEEVYTEAVF